VEPITLVIADNPLRVPVEEGLVVTVIAPTEPERRSNRGRVFRSTKDDYHYPHRHSLQLHLLLPQETAESEETDAAKTIGAATTMIVMMPRRLRIEYQSPMTIYARSVTAIMQTPGAPDPCAPSASEPTTAIRIVLCRCKTLMSYGAGCLVSSSCAGDATGTGPLWQYWQRMRGVPGESQSILKTKGPESRWHYY